MRCQNPTCDREVWQMSGKGRPREFCSRDCQIATLRHGGHFILRTPVPATVAYRLETHARQEKMTVEEYVLMLIKEDMG